LLPLIPEKLWKIDESTIGKHFSLREGDQCFYIWEYTANKRYDFSPTNQLISNLKIKPGQIAIASGRNHYKQQAINHAANALRRLMPQSYVETHATFVPVPGSKAAGDPEHDDRLVKVLQRAFQGWTTDARQMLELTESTPADHETNDRLTYDELLGITRLNNPSERMVKPVVVIVDDVLNSGKHFKVAQTLITAAYPNVEIRGLFFARCVRIDPLDEFEVLSDE
jgi:hypothetical protein